MANINPLAQFILSFEGGFVNDPADKGGATNRGVTIATWRAQGYDKDGDGDIDVQDLKLITADDATNIMRKNYWNRWRADEIKSQGIANILVDWLWSSGKYGIIIPQQVIGVTADGIVGPKTISAINSQNPSILFDKLKKRRRQYIDSIVANSVASYKKKIGRTPTYSETMKHTNKRFEAGWIRRLNAINMSYLVDNKGKAIYW